MINLIGKRNAGYTIVEQGKEAVIARDSEGNYVTWTYYADGKGITDFYWGRYTGKDYLDCVKRFLMKEQNIYSGD